MIWVGYIIIMTILGIIVYGGSVYCRICDKHFFFYQEYFPLLLFIAVWPFSILLGLLYLLIYFSIEIDKLIVNCLKSILKK